MGWAIRGNDDSLAQASKPIPIGETGSGAVPALQEMYDEVNDVKPTSSMIPKLSIHNFRPSEALINKALRS